MQPYLIDRVTDAEGATLMQATNRTAGDASIRAIDERNAFVMTSLLQRVAEYGTARRAVRELKRHDIAGKTGTSMIVRTRGSADSPAVPQPSAGWDTTRLNPWGHAKPEVV